MITLEESIPAKSANYRIAEDVFYIQFNDISFYIEDEEQENFFYCILKKIFSNIKIEKIFPLNGKDNVIKESNKNIGDKTKVFIVDKDFDDLLNKFHSNENLFYLDRYSIENFLIEEKALINYIISERPKLKLQEINNIFNLEANILNINNKLIPIIFLHILVQNKCPNLKNISLNHERFFNFDNGNFSLKEIQLINYKNLIQVELSKIDRRLTINAQLKYIKKTVCLNNTHLCIKHIPGKYLMKMIKQVIESLFGLASRNFDSFCYRLAENCSFNSLNGLKLQIENYI